MFSRSSQSSRIFTDWDVFFKLRVPRWSVSSTDQGLLDFFDLMFASQIIVCGRMSIFVLRVHILTYHLRFENWRFDNLHFLTFIWDFLIVCFFCRFYWVPLEFQQHYFKVWLQAASLIYFFVDHRFSLPVHRVLSRIAPSLCSFLIPRDGFPLTPVYGRNFPKYHCTSQSNFDTIGHPHQTLPASPRSQIFYD